MRLDQLEARLAAQVIGQPRASTILVVIIYNAVRPALIKANLIHVYVTAANAK